MKKCGHGFSFALWICPLLDNAKSFKYRIVASEGGDREAGDRKNTTAQNLTQW